MKVLQVHNRYRKPGGEDTVLANEARLLREHGHEVQLLEVHNDEHEPASLPAKLALVRDLCWSGTGAGALQQALQAHRPDVVHVHNTFHRLSPRVLRVARQAGVAVVQTLHNFRLLCANGLLLRDNLPCEQCVGQGRWHAVQHACYRGNRLASAAVTFSGALHLGLDTYRGPGLRVIALTEFGREVFRRGGLSDAVLRVKPNFVYPAPASAPVASRPQRVLYVGRLTEDKGVDLLLQAWRALRPPGWTLELLGEGPLQEGPAAAADGVHFLGWRQAPEVLQRVAAARYLVMASRWYETFGMVLLEALSAATPVVVPGHGAMAEIVTDGHDGLHFRPGDAASLQAVLARALALPEAGWQALSEAAVQTYRARYSPATNHAQLMAIYAEARAELPA
jgi:glycosyltransferase involved in cell wall biosynthesis